MARMLGRYQVPWSRHLRSGKRGCGECEMGWPYGRSRRIPKRREQRAVRIVIEEEGLPDMTEEHWPTWDELRAEDKAAGRLDEAKIADARDKIRARMTAGECIVPREALDRMARDGEAAGLYEATEGKPPKTR